MRSANGARMHLSKASSLVNMLAFGLSCALLQSCGADADPTAPLEEGPEELTTATGTVFNTSLLNVRSKPSTQSAIVKTLSAGTKVQISCQVSGESVSGNSVWDYLPAHGGYVADAYLYTGHSAFIPGIAKCGESGCGTLDYKGQCQGSLLVWCEGGVKRSKDCSADGRSCGYQDSSVGYNCLGQSSGAGSTGPFYVRGTKLGTTQSKWVSQIGKQIVPEMRGTRSERLDKAAYVAWWSLKEGVLDLDNALAYSNCHFPPDQHIGPLSVCPNANNAWQVGISGVQAAWRTLSDVESLAIKVHPEKSTTQILIDAASAAGFGPSTSTGKAIASSTGRLRLSWLLREGAVGFEAQYPTVKSECFVTCSSGWESTCKWCFGSGWTTSAKFAPTRSASQQSISDLRAIFNGLAP
jgi:hypothetical protein